MKVPPPKPTGKNVHAWGGQEKAEEKSLDNPQKLY